MPKEAAITVRVPIELKRRLAARAAQERRSISAQVVHELERSLAGAEQSADDATPTRAVLGSHSGLRVPSDREIAQVRAALWRRLDRTTSG